MLIKDSCRGALIAECVISGIFMKACAVALCLTCLVFPAGCGGGGGDGAGDSGNGNVTRDEATQLAEMIPLAFPFEDPSKATNLGSFGCPDWNGPGSPHPGLDVSTSANMGYGRVRLVSPAQGTVTRIDFQDDAIHGVMPMIWIRIDETLYCSISIEPGTTDAAVVSQQRQAVYVEVGQTVSPGDFIAELVFDPTGGNGGGIHMDLQIGNGRMLCPYNYSSSDAKAIYDSITEYNMGERSSVPCYVDELAQQ